MCLGVTDASQWRPTNRDQMRGRTRFDEIFTKRSIMVQQNEQMCVIQQVIFNLIINLFKAYLRLQSVLCHTACPTASLRASVIWHPGKKKKKYDKSRIFSHKTLIQYTQGSTCVQLDSCLTFDFMLLNEAIIFAFLRSG